MSLPEADRVELPVYAKRFPYVNGGLFNEVIAVPRFLRGSLRYLLDAAMLNWREINPDIFGSMIQSIVNQDQRGELGLHYTSVPNILKVLDPLLLDELRQQAKDYWHNRKALRQLLERLSNIRIFDPACGSGNFLVIAYRELRNIEMTIVTRLAVLDNVPAPLWSHVSLRNFFGIEYTDFAAETAKLSLWIAEYQLNSVYETEFGKRHPALPISSSANIVCCNALTTNWSSVCPPTNDARVETFIVGNPPYLGSVQQSAEQKSDMKAIFEGRTRLFKDLDYVSCWFVLATDYIRLAQCKSAFVATNSICQGEQVDMLWPILLNSRIEIAFAHTAFKWRNNAAENAGVSCVIIGLRKAGAHGTITLFDSEIARRVSNINPYLLAAPNIIVKKRTDSISDAPRMHKGCQPSDGGNLILSKNECEFLRREHPEHSDLIREFVGSLEFIRGSMRWCLWIPDERVPELRKLKFFAHRFDKIGELRKAGGTQSQEYADTPHKFVFSAHRDSYNIIVPRVFSENREFLTVGLVDGRKTVVSDNAMVLYAADTSYFSILSSRMHISWIRTVCGQLESRIRYSNTLGWNTFAIPPLTEVEKASLKQSAENILLAREGYFDKTIADLYDPDRMVHEFADLLNAHQENDELVEKIYIGRAFRSDAERLEHLFSRYSEMVEAE